MTEHKTMNTIIHAAFRRDFARMDSALGSFPADSRTRADQLAGAWDNISFQLHHHHTDEETIFWPLLRELGADDALVNDLDGEHQRMLKALEAADTSMKTFRTDPSANNTQAARSAVSELRSVLEEHLEHEERDLEPLAVRLHDAPQFKQALRAVRKAHKGNSGTFMAWLQDGADADALAGLRREVPPPVLFVVSRIAGRDYRRRIAPVWAA